MKKLASFLLLLLMVFSCRDQEESVTSNPQEEQITLIYKSDSYVGEADSPELQAIASQTPETSVIINHPSKPATYLLFDSNSEALEYFESHDLGVHDALENHFANAAKPMSDAQADSKTQYSWNGFYIYENNLPCAFVSGPICYLNTPTQYGYYKPYIGCQQSEHSFDIHVPSGKAVIELEPAFKMGCTGYFNNQIIIATSSGCYNIRFPFCKYPTTTVLGFRWSYTP